MAGKTTGWLILIVLVTVVIGGYASAWHGKRSFVRRGAACLVALLSGLAGAVGIIVYAIPALQDFRNSEVSFGNGIRWKLPDLGNFYGSLDCGNTVCPSRLEV